jgi:hypothetical protein
MDKYDQAIEYLKNNPYRIKTCWLNAIHSDDVNTSLFNWAYREGMSDDYREEVRALPEHKDKIYCSPDYGCLTQIKASPGSYLGATKEITDKILADDRIPNNPDDITVDNLHVFAEYQRMVDEAYETSQN